MTININKLDIFIPSMPETEDYLRLCLKSCLDGKVNDDTKVIVWLQGYEENAFVKLKEDFPNVGFIASKVNVGQPHSMNRFASKFSVAEKILILNDDMVMSPGFDKKVLDVSASITTPHLLSIQIVEPGHKVEVAPHFIKKSFGIDVKSFDFDGFIDFDKNRKPFKTKPLNYQPYLPFLIDRKLYNAVGGWDEAFGTGVVADSDFYNKFRYLGIPMIQTDISLVYHFSGKATRHNPDFDFKEIEENNQRILNLKWNI